MQTDSVFKLTLADIRHRLDQILDYTFNLLAFKQKSHAKQILVLNESLLEQWSDLLGKMIRWKDQKTIPNRPLRTSGRLKEQHQISRISHIPPQSSNISCNNVLLNIQSTHIDAFQIKEKDGKSGFGFIAQKSRLQFGKGILHRYCSDTPCDSHNVLLIGGSRHQNPNLKSHEILNLNLITKEIVKIGDLPYGVSSHAAMKVEQKIYIVGGNKNHNIVTSKCLQFDLAKRSVVKISDLNYPSASHALLNWHGRYIYKFGGIGCCFGQWDLSPYIQRYSIAADEWDIINPTVNINEDLLHHYSLLVNSMVYTSNRNSIVVLGGFDFSKKGSRKVFEIAVKETGDGKEMKETHEIVALGEVQAIKPGGFWSQEVAAIGDNLFALQTTTTEKGLEHRVLRIGKEISYIS